MRTREEIEAELVKLKEEMAVVRSAIRKLEWVLRREEDSLPVKKSPSPTTDIGGIQKRY